MARNVMRSAFKIVWIREARIALVMCYLMCLRADFLVGFPGTLRIGNFLASCLIFCGHIVE